MLFMFVFLGGRAVRGDPPPVADDLKKLLYGFRI